MQHHWTQKFACKERGRNRHRHRVCVFQIRKCRENRWETLELLLAVSCVCFLRGYTIHSRGKHPEKNLLRVQCSRITTIVKRRVLLYTFWSLTTDKRVHFQIKWACSHFVWDVAKKMENFTQMQSGRSTALRPGHVHIYKWLMCIYCLMKAEPILANENWK